MAPALRRKAPEISERRKLAILFTCVGRRVELLDAFRRAAQRLKIALSVHGSDRSWFAPAMHHVDHAHIVPALDDPEYLDALLAIVRRHRVGLAIPLIDSELLMMSRATGAFNRAGCRVVVSSENVVQICRDKLVTHRLLTETGIDTPSTWGHAEALKRTRHHFPYFMKPRAGSAGAGNYKINTVAELKTLGARITDPIVQEFVGGCEHTLDVYTGFDGIPRCVVPRRRLEIRSGEVSKGVVVKDRAVMAVGRRVALALRDCRGVITVQCMVTEGHRIRVLEINPRFGGGAPLAIHAGADFPLWLMAEHLGRPIRINPTGFRANVTMLRYDQSVFCTLRDAAPESP